MSELENEDVNYLPSNPADRKKIMESLNLITGLMQEITDRRESIKASYELLHEDYNISKKVLRKLAKTLYDANYDEVSTENTEFEIMYETLVKGTSRDDNCTTESDANEE